MEKTDINTVTVIRSIRDRHYSQLKGKNAQEKIAFYRAKAQRLHARLARKEQAGKPTLVTQA